MPSSGSGSITPIPSGGGALPAGQPIPYTLLSVGRYAKLFGLAPMHFWGAVAASLNPAVFPVGSCSSIWPQHDWQNFDLISREALAYAIQDAEKDVARAIGFWPAPMWISQEVNEFPRDFYRTSLFQTHDARYLPKGISAQTGKVLAGGRRAVTLVGSADTVGGSLVYNDDDGDGYAENAVITMATALTNVQEIKVYHTGHAGVQEWEVRPVDSKTITGGILTIRLKSWLLIDPNLYEEYPTDDGYQAIDLSTTANFVTAVDVYREYNDTTAVSSQFLWEQAGGCACGACGGTGCTACLDASQDGCLHVRDGHLGIVVPTPAAYSIADAEWQMAAYDVCRAPDRVRMYYYAGDQSNEFLAGSDYDPLSNSLAWVIAWIATARLERPPCTCAKHNDFFDSLRVDLSMSISGGASYAIANDVLDNPFGTHKGEIMAWRRIKHLVRKRPRVAMI